MRKEQVFEHSTESTHSLLLLPPGTYTGAVEHCEVIVDDNKEITLYVTIYVSHENAVYRLKVCQETYDDLKV